MSDMSKVALVTGSTGTLGRHVVSRLLARGWDVRVLSRHSREVKDGAQFMSGDLDTGAGIDAAVEGVEIIIHCAGSNTGDERKAATLVQAASRAHVRHLVYISVVGVDRIPVVGPVDRAMFGYFASKRAAERVVAESGIPWTTLRATQFHDLFLLVARQVARLPVIPLPSGFRFQPVDADEVAARLVELALAAPVGLAPDLAGPRIYTTAELLRSYLQSTHQRRLFVPIWLPGKAACVVKSGANLAPERADGRRTWEDFLAERVGTAHGSGSSLPVTAG